MRYLQHIDDGDQSRECPCLRCARAIIVLWKVALLGFCFPHACRSICPTLGVVVIGTKQLASEGVCVQLGFPVFAGFTLTVRVFFLVSHSLKWCFAGCDRLSRLYSAALLQFSSWYENEWFIKGSVCSIFNGSYQSLNLLSTERKG